MRIEKLTSTPDRAGRYRTELEDGQIFRLYRQTVEDFGLYPGKELDPEDLERLKDAAGEMSAKMRAVRILSATNVSEKDLEQRLIRKGEDAAQARAAVEWMRDLDLLDDRKTAEQVVESCIRKGYGPARARQALYEKRIPKSLWDWALEDYPDQSDYILDYLRDHLPEDADQKALRKMIDALLRRGHPYARIRSALSRLDMDTGDLPEE